MPAPVTRRLSLALPMLFYLLALLALRLHLPTGDLGLLVVATLSGLAGLGTAIGFVFSHRVFLGRLSSGG